MPNERTTERPVLVAITSILVVIEALLLFAAAALALSGLYNESRGILAPQATYGLSGAFIIFGIFLLVAAHYFFRGRRWTRSFILVWQVLMIIISFSFFQQKDYLLFGTMLTLGASILILLFAKPVVQYVSVTGNGQ